MNHFSKFLSVLTLSLIGLSSLGIGAEIGDQSKKYSFSATNGFRDYNIPLSSANVKDISYIVTTLGSASLIKAMKSQSSMKKAGERVENVHPLNFLLCIFSSEELTAALSSIKEKSWAWKEFFGGLKKSLSDESKRNNMKPEFIQSFANALGIDAAAITPAIQQGRWDDFVNILISLKPRTNNNQNRYNV